MGHIDWISTESAMDLCCLHDANKHPHKQTPRHKDEIFACSLTFGKPNQQENNKRFENCNPAIVQGRK